MGALLQTWLDLTLDLKIITLILSPFVGLTILLGWAAPYVVAPIARPKHLGENSYYQARTKAYNRRPNVPIGQVNKGILNIRVPAAIRVSETLIVHVNLRTEKRNSTDWQSKPTLTSPDFNIVVGDTGIESGDFKWNWLISSQKMGDRVLYLAFDPPCDLDLSEDLEKSNMFFNGNSIRIPIIVLDELGLTAWQRIAFTAIGGFLGLLATIIMALHYLRRKKSSQEQAQITLSREQAEAVLMKMVKDGLVTEEEFLQFLQTYAKPDQQVPSKQKSQKPPPHRKR
jgi:hypothetical protein